MDPFCTIFDIFRCKKVPHCSVFKILYIYLFADPSRTADNELLAKTQQEISHQDPKFPTECFWLTALYHHIAVVPQCRKMEKIMKELYNFTREYKRVKEARPNNDAEGTFLKLTFFKFI